MAGTANLRLLVSPLDGSTDPVEVVAGMVEGRQWERENKASVGKAIEDSPMVIVELAFYAWRRRHASGSDRGISLDEFEERFDVDLLQGDDLPVPSDPATAPLTD